MNPIEITVIVDRIEGDWVVLEWLDEFVQVPLATFSSRPEEGAAFKLSLQPDPEASERMTAQVKQLLEAMEDDDDGSDIDL